MNSAEKEAEKILEAAFDVIEEGGCIEGEDCPAHFRVDDVYLDDEVEYARIITYVGEYCVITDDNTDLEDPMLIVRAMLGLVAKEDLPPRFETVVYHVGEGSVGELAKMDLAARKASIRYVKAQDDWDQVKAEHDAVTWMLREGLIDVSKAVGE
jgi:hypothetical protein